MNVNLFNGDCLEIMEKIPDKSVNMVFADLPYGTTACKWDRLIPPESLWKQYRRIISDDGAIVLFGSEPFATKMRMNALDLFKYDWIWLKNTCSGFVHSKNMPLKNFEIISVFSKASILHKSHNGIRMIYNPQGLEKTEYIRYDGKRTMKNIYGKRPSNKDKIVQEFTNYPKMTLNFPNDEKNLHPTQKPVALLEYLIRTYTNAGMTVLDNCMGSGSTGVACLNTGRNFVGIEKDEEFFRIAEKRINESYKLCVKI